MSVLPPAIVATVTSQTFYARVSGNLRATGSVLQSENHFARGPAGFPEKPEREVGAFSFSRKDAPGW